MAPKEGSRMGLLLAIPIAIVTWEIVSYIVLNFNPAILFPIFFTLLMLLFFKKTIDSIVK